MKIRDIKGNDVKASMPGAFILQAGRAGNMHIQSWPKKRGPYKDPQQVQRLSWFRQAIAYSVNMTPMEQRAAVEQSKDSPYLWRDLAIMGAYGRLVDIVLKDGTKLTGLRMADTAVSRMLDQLGQTPGAMAVRGEDQWILLPPGTAGDVLTAGANGVLPDWAPAAAPAAGGKVWLTPIGDVARSQNYATLISPFMPAVDCKASRILMPAVYASGQQYAPLVTVWNGTTIGAIIATGPAVTVSVDGTYMLELGLSTAAEFTAGDTYGIGFVRKDGSGTATTQARATGTGHAGWPQTSPKGYAYFATNTPTEGDTGLATSSYWLSYALELEP